jgi:hypothetical protein
MCLLVLPGFEWPDTKKGSGNLNDSGPMVTCRSCIASNNALCTLAGARLISSARTKLANIGPFFTENCSSFLIVNHGADQVSGQ